MKFKRLRHNKNCIGVYEEIASGNASKFRNNALMHLTCQGNSKFMNHASLEKDYGRAMKPDELAKFLGIDRRTVIKYSDRWGGIEVSPGKYRFFEKIIRRKIDAQFNNEKGKEEMAGHYNGQWRKKRSTVSGQLKGILSGSSPMGKLGKRKANKRTDRHGLLDAV